MPREPRGTLTGRVLEEALVNGRAARVTVRTLRAKPGPNGLRTILRYQEVAGVRYFDAAGSRPHVGCRDACRQCWPSGATLNARSSSGLPVSGWTSSRYLRVWAR